MSENGVLMFSMVVESSKLDWYENGRYEVYRSDGSFNCCSYWKYEDDRLWYKHRESETWHKVRDDENLFEQWVKLYSSYMLEKEVFSDGVE